MCDRCGTIFSENSEDWSTYQGSIKKKGDRGRGDWETVALDACAACTRPFSGELPVPRLAVPEGKYDPAKTAALEQELGIGKDSP